MDASTLVAWGIWRFRSSGAGLLDSRWGRVICIDPLQLRTIGPLYLMHDSMVEGPNLGSQSGICFTDPDVGVFRSDERAFTTMLMVGPRRQSL